MICPDKPKCSNINHKDVDATVLCPSCNKFFCPSCEKLHGELLSDHQSVLISDIPSGLKIITGRCNVHGHHNNPLEYYCKDHSISCCVACLCPKEDVGKHSKCQTVLLKDVEQHMKSTLGDVIKELEKEISNTEASLSKIKDVQGKNEEAKNEIVKQIKANFTEIREAIDTREKELLGLVEELWDKEASCDKLIETGTECPEKARQVVVIAKKVEQHWDTNHLPEMVQNYDTVVDTTKELTKFCSDVDKVTSKDLEIRFSPEKETIDAFIEEIKKFGDVFIKPIYVVSMKKSPNNKYVLEGPNKSSVRKLSNDGKWDCTVIGSNTLPLNTIIKWDVKITSTRDGWIMVGVAPFDINQINADNNYTKCGWYFYCGNSSLYSGPPHNYSNKPYGQGKKLQSGAIVGITMNTIKRELSFSVNGKDLGVAFSDIPLDKLLVPTIELEIMNDSVEIISHN